MLDAVFGICRICSNRPLEWTSITDCNPVLLPALLAMGKIDPFGILPVESTREVQELIHHCESGYF
jgi:hypothetical protein